MAIAEASSSRQRVRADKNRIRDDRPILLHAHQWIFQVCRLPFWRRCRELLELSVPLSGPGRRRCARSAAASALRSPCLVGCWPDLDWVVEGDAAALVAELVARSALNASADVQEHGAFGTVAFQLDGIGLIWPRRDRSTTPPQPRIPWCERAPSRLTLLAAISRSMPWPSIWWPVS